MKWLAAVVAGALLFAACGKAADPVPPRPSPTPTIAANVTAGPRTVTDMIGRRVRLTEEVRTVAAMSPASAEFAAELGLEIVGRTTDTAESVAPAAKPAGSSLTPDFTAIAVLKPDLVIADAAFHSGRTRDFEKFPYPVFVIKAASYGEVLATLVALGEATGRTVEAERARSAIEERAGAVALKARAQAGEPPKVLVVTGGGRDAFGGGSGTYIGSLLEQLGAVNVLGAAPEGGPIPGFGVIEIAQAANNNPDVVLVLPSSQGGLAEQIRAEPAWAGTPAVRDGRVYELDVALYLRAPGPRVAEALEGLYGLLWPR
ncbi:MAG: ABC transporter substrate-binding protein [Dehalococcoidia bacterium]|nr:ABC transporter substrate-binding protein [Dehalococcoidia bacterium]